MKRVAVGLSGGVDSSVAAALLVQAGHAVLGAAMKTWDGRPSATGTGRHGCYGPGEEADIADAARVAAHLGIPFHILDLSREFTSEVLADFSRQYRSGLTPNPCVRCNRYVKFGLIPARLKAAGIPFDAFATGHYATIDTDPLRARHILKRGADRRKDQSYFLYLLTQDQLSSTIFPLGDRTKSEVRRIARDLGLPVAERPESQDFYEGRHADLFEQPARPGPILSPDGEILGQHRGIHRYTIGQRRGLGAHRAPLYVLDIDPGRDAVIAGPEDRLMTAELTAGSLNWIAFETLTAPIQVKAQIRYRHVASDAVVLPRDDARVDVRFSAPQRAVTPGQAVVFYDGDAVLGGGTIERRATGGIPPDF